MIITRTSGSIGDTDQRKWLDEWLANWSDLVDFEVYPVISSREAAEKVSSRGIPGSLGDEGVEFEARRI